VPEPKARQRGIRCQHGRKTDQRYRDRYPAARLIVGPDVKLKGAEILDCDTLASKAASRPPWTAASSASPTRAFSGKVSIDVAEIHGTFEAN
jgi:hypothetical protein